MKKAISVILTVFVLTLLCSCGQSSTDEWEQITPAEETVTLPAASDTAVSAAAQSETSTASSASVTDPSVEKTKAEKTAASNQTVSSAVPATSVTQNAVSAKTTTRAPSETATVFSVERQVNEVLRLTNTYRRAVLAPELTLDTDLCRAATLRAQECADSRDIDHTRPDGRNCQTVLDDMGIDYTVMGENLAMGQVSAEDVCEQWKGSSGHYRNMVNRKYSKIGIGLAADENGIGYWVQIFSD